MAPFHVPALHMGQSDSRNDGQREGQYDPEAFNDHVLGPTAQPQKQRGKQRRIPMLHVTRLQHCREGRLLSALHLPLLLSIRSAPSYY